MPTQSQCLAPPTLGGLALLLSFPEHPPATHPPKRSLFCGYPPAWEGLSANYPECLPSQASAGPR